jgi:hypothetical protein
MEVLCGKVNRHKAKSTTVVEDFVFNWCAAIYKGYSESNHRLF